MDLDLTSLSSNLPHNPRASSDEAPDNNEQSATVFTSFKQAALSVTTLFKTAALENERSHREGVSEGYNVCLDDIITFLNKIDGRADRNSVELFRQWALSKRRKIGPRRSKERQEGRDASSECEASMERSPPPETSHQVTPTFQAQPATQEPPKIQPPQAPVFNFRSDYIMPQHPEMIEMELADSDIASPPSSPKLASQHIFSTPRKNFSDTRNRHTQSRGQKRRFQSSFDNFFNLAEMEKLHGAKKGRYQ